VEEPPSPAEPEPIPELSPIHPPTEERTDDPAATTESPEPEKVVEEKKEEEKKKKPYPPPAYLSIKEYSSSPLSPHIPTTLEPSQPLFQQHILGFLKTPLRIYQFLNRRHLADQMGRETAAIVLAASRPYEQSSSFATPEPELDATPVATSAPEKDANDAAVQTSQTWEQQTALEIEEVTWHKSVRKPRKEDDNSERVWLDDIIIDHRIGDRMRKFTLDPEEEERAERIGSGAEKTRAIPVHDLSAEKVVIGDIEKDL
jgi:import inner membrane translocase subunit TIM54